MKETIVTYDQKYRYVHKIIPARSFQTIVKKKSTAIPIYFKFNNHLKVKRPRKQDKETINKAKTMNINNFLFNINNHSPK